MSIVVKRIFSVLCTIIVLAASAAAWYFIEISFDGCCGAPASYDNDSLQALSHLAAYVVAFGLIFFVLRWGWRKK